MARDAAAGAMVATGAGQPFSLPFPAPAAAFPFPSAFPMAPAAKPFPFPGRGQAFPFPMADAQAEEKGAGRALRFSRGAGAGECGDIRSMAEHGQLVEHVVMVPENLETPLELGDRGQPVVAVFKENHLDRLGDDGHRFGDRGKFLTDGAHDRISLVATLSE